MPGCSTNDNLHLSLVKVPPGSVVMVRLDSPASVRHGCATTARTPPWGDEKGSARARQWRMSAAPAPSSPAALLVLMNSELMHAAWAELSPDARRRCLERVGALVEGMGPLEDEADATAARWLAGMLRQCGPGA